MEDFKIKILSKLRDIKPEKLVYPLISGLFILVALILFVVSANFISEHVNKALTDQITAEGLISINKEVFEPVKNKLNIKLNENPGEVPASSLPPVSETSNSEPIETTSPAASAETPETATTTAPQPVAITPEEKSALKISVLNSTKTSGLAAELKKVLEESGFTVLKTGNYSPLLDGTVVKIKKGKEKYKDVLLEAISSKYAVKEFQEAPENDPYDFIIIIGE